MPKIETITRAQLVETAALLAGDGDTLPFWDESEYVRALCELIADATGSDDPENAKSEVWDEMSAAHARFERQYHARAIARAALDRHADIHAESLTGQDALTIATTAALQALEEKENDR